MCLSCIWTAFSLVGYRLCSPCMISTTCNISSKCLILTVAYKSPLSLPNYFSSPSWHLLSAKIQTCKSWYIKIKLSRAMKLLWNSCGRKKRQSKHYWTIGDLNHCHLWKWELRNHFILPCPISATRKTPEGINLALVLLSLQKHHCNLDV